MSALKAENKKGRDVLAERLQPLTSAKAELQARARKDPTPFFELPPSEAPHPASQVFALRGPAAGVAEQERRTG